MWVILTNLFRSLLGIFNNKIYLILLLITLVFSICSWYYISTENKILKYKSEILELTSKNTAYSDAIRKQNEYYSEIVSRQQNLISQFKKKQSEINSRYSLSNQQLFKPKDSVSSSVLWLRQRAKEIIW